jgi:hypothetical protein
MNINNIFLEKETRTHLNTEVTAALLSRQPQTLRMWACKERGPIRPIRINGRLAWPVDKIREILGVTNQPDAQERTVSHGSWSRRS